VTRTRALAFSGLLIGVLLLLAVVEASAAEKRLRLSTTTSTENSGLLAALIPPFEARFGLQVDVIPVGTGKALKLAEGGDVDVTLVHAPELEEQFVKQGFGVNRRYVMYNDFVIVGPPHDPAGIKNAPDAKRAFQRIEKQVSARHSRGTWSQGAEWARCLSSRTRSGLTPLPTAEPFCPFARSSTSRFS